jgi:hypothetical protein
MTTAEVLREVKAGIRAVPAMGMIASGMLVGWILSFAFLLIKTLMGQAAGWNVLGVFGYLGGSTDKLAVVLLDIARYVAVPLAVLGVGHLVGRRGSLKWALVGSAIAELWAVACPVPPAPLTQVQLYYMLWVVTASLLATLGYHVREQVPSSSYASHPRTATRTGLRAQREVRRRDTAGDLLARLILGILWMALCWLVESIMSGLR